MENYLAIWGACLSTILAVIKVFEFWKSRLCVYTSFAFTDEPDRGNEIIIENPSNQGLIIKHWELIWKKKT